MYFPNMNKKSITLSMILLLGVNTPLLAANVLSKKTDDQSVMTLITSKSQNLAVNVLKNNNRKFTAYSNGAGQWQTKKSKNWCSGFVPGLFWYIYALTGEDIWKTHAQSWTEGVRSRAYATDNDTGFQIFDSFGLGYTIGGENNADYKGILINGANTMVKQRYNANIGAFRSWDQKIDNPTQLPFEVNIDQMMNMELILWVGQNNERPDMTAMAISHADRTWENNIRDDGSSYHVVSYDLDGKAIEKRTHQGWKTDSTWSRGQAWSVYAYAMFYRYTGLDRMLQRSLKSYQYFITATQHQTNDWVAYSDFDAPLDKNNPRDTSATAIVASALLELYHISKDEKYLNDAQAMLEALSSAQFLATDPQYQPILAKGSEKWGKGEVGTIFGDYFFVEALYRWQLWSPRKLPDNFGL